MQPTEQCYQYQVIELRRNLVLDASAEANATSERSARRRCHKKWPASAYRLHLVWHGTVEQGAVAR